MAGDLQQEINSQMNNPKLPRGVITLKNMQGSVDLKKNMRHVFIDCDVTVNSAEEMVEATFVNCKSVAINAFTSGVIRLESKEVSKLKATNAKINSDGAKIEELDLEGCETTFFNATIQQAKFKDCDVTGFNNKWEGETTFEGGTYYGEDDEFKAECTLSNGASIRGPRLKMQGAFSMDGATIETDHPEFNDEFESKGVSHVLIDHGQFKGKASFTEDGTTVLTNAEFKDTVEAEDGYFQITDGEFSDNLTIKNAKFTGVNLTCKGDLEASADEAGSLVLTQGKVSGSVTVKKCGVRISEVQFEDDCTFEDGALDSDKATYKDLTITGGKFESFGDTIKTLTGTKLVGHSIIRSCKDAETISLEGEDSCSLLVDSLESAETLEIKKHSNVRLVGASPSKVTVESCGIVQLDGCTIEDGTVKKVGTFLSNDTSTITKLDMEDVQLAVTKGVSEFTTKNSTHIDNGSTFLTADACIIIGTDTTVTDSTGCLINAMGGDITASEASVVTTVGATVTNLDGLTSGTGFDPDMSGGALLYGDDLLLQASIGKLILKALTDDVLVDATVGNIKTTSTLATEIKALTSIKTESTLDTEIKATTSIKLDSTLDTAINATTDISLNAAVALSMEGTASASLSSAAEVSLDGASVGISGEATVALTAPMVLLNSGAGGAPELVTISGGLTTVLGEAVGLTATLGPVASLQSSLSSLTSAMSTIQSIGSSFGTLSSALGGLSSLTSALGTFKTAMSGVTSALGNIQGTLSKLTSLSSVFTNLSSFSSLSAVASSLNSLGNMNSITGSGGSASMTTSLSTLQGAVNSVTAAIPHLQTLATASNLSGMNAAFSDIHTAVSSFTVSSAKTDVSSGGTSYTAVVTNFVPSVVTASSSVKTALI